MQRRLTIGALAAAIALTGVAAHGASAAGQPEHDDPAHAPTAGHAAHGTPETGGIDGEALRQRITGEKDAGTVAGPETRRAPVALRESETAASGNDTPGDAETVPSASARPGRNVSVEGTLATPSITPRDVAPSRLDDGSIPLARDLRIGSGQAASTTGRIGDGPDASSGDFDFYRVDARRGDSVEVDVTAAADLAPIVVLYDARGRLVVGAGPTVTDGQTRLSHPVDRRGAYYVSIGMTKPMDPFDPAAGLKAEGTGPYDLDVTVRPQGTSDTDVYAVTARKGDVLGATVSGSGRLVGILGSDGRQVQTSAVDAGALYPKSSPLPRGGNATVNHPVTRSGRYYLTVTDGSGDYTLTTGAHRAPTAAERGRETVLLDFSGPTFDNRIFGQGAVEPGTRTVSPMRDYLTDWGLTAADEAAVVRATTTRVREILRSDIPGSQIRIVTSLSHPQLVGDPAVSRVIIGGTPAEAGLGPVAGLAESIDPGNFDRDETAVVLAGQMIKGGSVDLDQFMDEDSDRVRAVGQVLGNVGGHEIGHLLGNHHTDDEDDPTQVMNTGNLGNFLALGPDLVAGTDDDARLAMGRSRFDPLQGFVGLEDTQWRTRLALR